MAVSDAVRLPKGLFPDIYSIAENEELRQETCRPKHCRALLSPIRPTRRQFDSIVLAGLLTRGSRPSVSPSRTYPVAFETVAHRSQLRGQSRFADP